jgi:hypothetical protein
MRSLSPAFTGTFADTLIRDTRLEPAGEQAYGVFAENPTLEVATRTEAHRNHLHRTRHL